jgi:hypothetical protein
MGGRLYAEEIMKKRAYTKLIHEGRYVAEVDVNLIEANEGWSPYLSLEDAYKLDDIREALRRGDIEEAAKSARVYTLVPVAV